MANNDAEIASLRAELEALKAAGTVAPSTNVPFNAGGIGTEIRESWSQYDQELANRGEHPLQQE